MVKKINDALAFVIEMIIIFLYGKWGFELSTNPFILIILMLFFVLGFALIWAIFFLPKAKYQIKDKHYWLYKFLILFIPFYSIEQQISQCW